jgi:hypothetical protein
MHAPPHHPTRVRYSQQGLQTWWPWALTWRMTLAAALLVTWMAPHLTQAKTFRCGVADTPCLIASITEANTNGQKANDIRLEAGTYTLTAVNNTTDGPNGLPSVTSTLTITGEGAEATMIERAASAPELRLMHVAASGRLTLEGLSLTGGNLVFGSGAGIWNDGTVTLTNNSALTGNVTLFGSGAGIWNHGTLTLTNSTVDDNFAPQEGAGGIWNDGTVTLTNSSLTNNRGGQAIGGGIVNDGLLTITNSTVAHNSGEGAGGIFNDGLLTLTNSTVADNYARSTGGGISNRGTLTLTNSTLAYNQAGSAGGVGGIFTSGTLILQNTILALNLSPIGGPDCNGLITSLGNNLIGNPSGCTITLLLTDLIGDPRLGPFIDTGEPGEGYFPLLPTSRAINTGNDAACPKTDQLGKKRVGLCDIGAIEFQGKEVASQ